MTVLTSPESRVLPGEGFSRGFTPIVILVVVHFLFLAFFVAPAISTPDANGYIAQARLMRGRGGPISWSSRRRSMWGTTGWPWARGGTTASIRRVAGDARGGLPAVRAVSDALGDPGDGVAVAARPVSGRPRVGGAGLGALGGGR